jgi:predicted nucleic acid-binding Zn ribbon protein
MNRIDKANAVCNLYLNQHQKRKQTHLLTMYLIKLIVIQAFKIKNQF